MVVDGGNRVAGYCNRCGERVEVLKTVPWKENACTRCGSEDVETGP